MLVPVHASCASSPATLAALTSTPGANASTHAPVRPSAHARRSGRRRDDRAPGPRARPARAERARRRDERARRVARRDGAAAARVAARTAASGDRAPGPRAGPRAHVITAEGRDPKPSRFGNVRAPSRRRRRRPTRDVAAQSNTRAETTSALGANPDSTRRARDRRAVAETVPAGAAHGARSSASAAPRRRGGRRRPRDRRSRRATRRRPSRGRTRASARSSRPTIRARRESYPRRCDRDPRRRDLDPRRCDLDPRRRPSGGALVHAVERPGNRRGRRGGDAGRARGGDVFVFV